jgi:hypothetical protein
LNRRAFVIGVAAALATRRAGQAQPTKMARVAVLASSTEGNFGRAAWAWRPRSNTDEETLLTTGLT